MNRKPLIWIILCMFLIANGSVVLGITNNDHPEKGTTLSPNLAPNPSFEEGDTMPTGWGYDINSTGIYHWDSNYSFSGEKSVGVLNLTQVLEEVNWITTDFIPVNYAINSYILSVWYEIIGIPSTHQFATLNIWEYDQNYYLVGGMGTGSSLYAGWHQMELTTQYNSRVKYVKIELGQEAFSIEPNSSVEVRFDDVYFGIWNTAPIVPSIQGETNGRVRTVYEYTISTIDPDQDNISYEIDWGDNTTQVTDFYKSGEEIIISHIWGFEKTYTVRVRAIDEEDAESDWAILMVTMPCSYKLPIMQFWERLFERFPNVFPILRHILVN